MNFENNIKIKRKKIAIALSGGVDSAVACMLLKKKDYSLTGLYLKLFNEDSEENNARVIANFLGIPFYTIDAIDEFKKKIINYFLEEYKKERTPNPCIKCNKDIKFGLLFKKAMEMGFDKLATGHYVRKVQSSRQRRVSFWRTKFKVQRYGLKIAKDKNKDQSYFLYNLTQEILERVEFPLGEYKKEEVKKMAKKFDLPILEKESQDICFLENANQRKWENEYTRKKGDHNEFLKKYIKMKKGDILTVAGKKVGEHQGLPLYTIGQRRAVGIGGTGPYYVVKKNIKDNILTVSEDRDDPLLYSDELFAGAVNWISGQEPRFPCKIKAKIRYRQDSEIAFLDKIRDVKENKLSAEKIKEIRNLKLEINNFYKVKFKNPQRAITSGQSVVFYKGNEMLGGGIISTNFTHEQLIFGLNKGFIYATKPFQIAKSLNFEFLALKFLIASFLEGNRREGKQLCPLENNSKI